MSSTLVITREEFIKLIKFGEIKICKNSVASDENQLVSIFASKSFDDELGFLVLDVTSNLFFSNTDCVFDLKIDDVEKISCLTPKALNFYQSKFDSRIDFQLLHGANDLINQIDINQSINDKKKGIKILFEVFGVEEAAESIQFIEQGFMGDELIQNLLSYQQVGYLNQGFKTWAHDLFCYSRKCNFFSNDFSYLLDLRTLSVLKTRAPEQINLFYSQNLNVLRNGESLQNAAPLNELLNEAIESVENNPSSSEDKKRDLKPFLLVGSIFLKSKTLLDPEDRMPNSWEVFMSHIHSFITEYRQETIKALYLLGVYLGYKYLYDDYYGWKPLAIFKRQPPHTYKEALSSNNYPPLLEHQSQPSTNALNTDDEFKEKNLNVASNSIDSERNSQSHDQLDLLDQNSSDKHDEICSNSNASVELYEQHHTKLDKYKKPELQEVVDRINKIDGFKSINRSQNKGDLLSAIKNWFSEKGFLNESN